MAATRVLIVDDNQGIRLGVRLYLEACGFEVRDAADCASSLRLLDEVAFDVGVLDYSLPDGTALTMLQEIHLRQPALRVIVLTAYPSAALAQAVLDAGAARFLTKPIEMATLRDLLDHLASGGADGR